jgi:hypothetical protein
MSDNLIRKCFQNSIEKENNTFWSILYLPGGKRIAFCYFLAGLDHADFLLQETSEKYPLLMAPKKVFTERIYFPFILICAHFLGELRLLEQ